MMARWLRAETLSGGSGESQIERGRGTIMFAVHIKYQGTGPMDAKQESFIKAESEEQAENIARAKLNDLDKYQIPGTVDIYELNLKQTLLDRKSVV